MPDASVPDTTPDASARAAARLRAVVDSLPDAVYVYDAQWCWTYVNPAAQSLLRRVGQDPEAVVGMVVWDALPRLRGSQFERGVRLARATGQVVTYEEYVTAYDAWFEQRIVPAPDETVTVYSRDVSARHRAAAALRESEARLLAQAEQLRTTASTLRGFLDSAPVLMGVVELVEEDGRDDILHVYDNPATDRFFGVARGASVGRRASELGASAEAIELWTRHYRQAEREDLPAHFEYAIDGPDGRRWLAVTLCVAGDGPAGRTRFTYVAEDATVRKAVEAERERLLSAERTARTDAEAASRAKSEFLAVMSHELRTPLNAIGGYAELMEMGIRGPVTEQQREDLARIQRSQRHLLGLINEVLNYARLESGAVTYELGDVPVAEAVAAAEALVAPQLRAKGLDFAIRCESAEIVARADPDKLQQILLNLLANAIKFTNVRPGLPGTVTVHCTADDRQVCVAVRDTGIGIPSHKLATIFEPFVQVDAALTRPHGGAGLGLAISRDLAGAMGGTLDVESEPGVGSTFTLRLPRAGR